MTVTLDPTKEVKEFDGKHISLVGDPGNEKRFILVQDGHTEKLMDACNKVAGMVGPMMQHISSEVYEALDTIRGSMMQMGGPEATVASYPQLYAKFEDGDEFDYRYPDAQELIPVLEGIDAVPDGSELKSAADAIRSFVERYTPDGWEFKDGAVYRPASLLKELTAEMVVRSAAAGEDASAMATLSSSLEPGKGVLVLQGTPLWDILETRAKEGHTGGRSLAEAPPDAQTPPEGGTDMKTGADAESYIRSLIQRSDVANGVQSPPEDGGGKEEIPPPVNTKSEQGGVSGDGDPLQELRTALAVPGLTREQKTGIFRHYTDQLEETMLNPEQEPSGDGVTLSALRSIIQDALAPLAERLEKVERGLNDPEVPNRRSLTPGRGRGGEPAFVRRSQPYEPRSIRELAETNTT